MPLSIKRKKTEMVGFMDVSSATRSIVLVTLSEEDTPARPWPYRETVRHGFNGRMTCGRGKMNVCPGWTTIRSLRFPFIRGRKFFAEALGCQGLLFGGQYAVCPSFAA